MEKIDYLEVPSGLLLKYITILEILIPPPVDSELAPTKVKTRIITCESNGHLL